MRKKKVFIFAAALMAMMLLSSTAGANLVGYWNFESNFWPTSGGAGLLATPVAGSPTPGVAGGQVGNCVYFNDATNDSLGLPVGFGTGTGTGASLGDDFSISAWYNLQPIEGNTSARFFVFEQYSGYDLSYGVRDLDSDGVDDGQAYTQGGYNTPQNFIDAGTQFTWHHVLATYDSDGTYTTITYWIDGVKQTTATPLGDESVDIGDVAIIIGDCRATSTDDRDWDGLIDEVAVWNHALSDVEAEAVYDLGIAGQPVPEPVTFMFLGLGSLALLRKRR
ncbi:MAG: hypothetical protein JXD22_07710 [Sedimentisphaerales bacterium]|nr:hypothetical protein [Sedimentisphaerales bacterium]